MMKEINSTSVKLDTFKDMFTEEVQSDDKATKMKRKTHHDNVPNLVMKGFDSYLNLEEKIQKLVEN